MQVFWRLEQCHLWDGIQLLLTHETLAAGSTAVPCPLCYRPPCSAFFSKTWKEEVCFHTPFLTKRTCHRLHIHDGRCREKTAKTTLQLDDLWMTQNRPWNNAIEWWQVKVKQSVGMLHPLLVLLNNVSSLGNLPFPCLKHSKCIYL